MGTGLKFAVLLKLGHEAEDLLGSFDVLGMAGNCRSAHIPERQAAGRVHSGVLDSQVHSPLSFSASIAIYKAPTMGLIPEVDNSGIKDAAGLGSGSTPSARNGYTCRSFPGW